MKRKITRIISMICVAALTMVSLPSCGLGEMKEFNGDMRERYDYNLKDYIKPGKYKEIKVNVGPDNISDRELKAKILEYRVLYTATVKSWDSVGEGVPAKENDIVDVIYQGYLDGEPLPDMVNYKEEGYSMTIGGDMVIEGMDEHLKGMMIGDKKTFDVTVPDPCFEYPYYVGKTITFDVEITGIRSAELEPYDEALFEYYGCTTEDEFKAQVINEIRRVRSNKLEEYVTSRVMDMVCQNFEVKKYPEKELEEVRTSLIDSDKAAAEKKGISVDEYITNEYKMSMSEYESSVDEYVKQFVFEEMVLYYIARNEQIGLTSAAFDEKATELAEENGLSTPAEYVSFMASYGYSEYSVRESIWFDLILEFIYDNSVQVKE